MREDATMQLGRKRFMQLAAATALWPATSRFAFADDYPTRPIHLVVPVPPAGTFDIVARLVANAVTPHLHQQIVIENRGGAGTNLGTGIVARAAPDGYTLLLAGSPGAINVTLYRHLDFSFPHDIAPVASIERAPLIVVVNPSLPATTIPEFIDYAKANPGKINSGSGGAGSTGRGAGHYRSSGRAGAGRVLDARLGDLLRQSRHLARPRRHQRQAHGRAARRA